VSYGKADLKEQLQASAVPDDAYLARELMTAFPERLQQSHGPDLEQHRLRREIIATQIANQMVNLMGINFAERLRTSTGAEIEHIVRAYVLARDVFSLQPIWQEVEALDYKVDAGVQLDMMHDLQHLIRRATRWFVRNRPAALDCEVEREHFAPHLQAITRNLGELLCGEPLEIWQAAYSRYTDAAVPARLAQVVAGSRSLYSALSIIEVASDLEVSVETAAQAFFGVGERLELQWFSGQLNDLNIGSYWQALARDTFRDDLDTQQRALTASVLRAAQRDQAPMSEHLDSWLEHNRPHIDRWLSMLAELKNASVQDYAMYTVAVRELADMARCSAQLE
jgi:glutamate dehydrogenase